MLVAEGNDNIKHNADISLAGSTLLPRAAIVNGIQLLFAVKLSSSPVGTSLLKRYRSFFFPFSRILISHLCYYTSRNEIHAISSLIHLSGWIL